MRVLTTSRIGSTTRRNVTKLLRSSKLEARSSKFRCNGMPLTAVEMLFAFLIDTLAAANAVKDRAGTAMYAKRTTPSSTEVR